MKSGISRLRNTLLRQDIEKVLKDNADKWLDAETVFHILLARSVSITLASVYRILKQLESQQILLRDWHYASKKVIYRLKSDSPASEYSILCRHCGSSLCGTDLELHNKIQQLAQQQGLTVSEQHFVIHVICIKCTK